MKPIYYYANNIYQFSYALPVYRQLGGSFVVKDPGRYLQFKRFFRQLAARKERTFLRTPPVMIMPREKLHRLSGVLVFFSNSIVPEHTYSTCTTIFHEHGTSDKRHGGRSHHIARAKLLKYDYIMLSGAKNRLKLDEEQLAISEDKLIPVGCIRFDRYREKEFCRQREMDRLGIQDRNRKNILYAPTWRFGNGTIRLYGLRFAREITRKYNLIIRPHFHDQKYGTYLKLRARLEGIDHVYFSNSSNLIRHDTFNDFTLSDLLISDTSAVIYEYLITRNPIILADNSYKSANATPDMMDIRQHADIFTGSDDIVAMIDRNLAERPFEAAYEEMVKSCFYHTETSSTDKAAAFLRQLQH